MNAIEGRIQSVSGTGRVRAVEVATSIGILPALVLDVGSPERLFEPGRRVKVLFKETSVVAASPLHRVEEGRVERIQRGDALCEIEVWWPCGQRIVAAMPASELAPDLSPGDPIRIHVPAATVSLELR